MKQYTVTEVIPYVVDAVSEKHACEIIQEDENRNAYLITIVSRDAVEKQRLAGLSSSSTVGV